MHPAAKKCDWSYKKDERMVVLKWKSIENYLKILMLWLIINGNGAYD